MLKVAFPSLDQLPQTREAGERRARDMTQWTRKCSVEAMQDGTKAQYSDGQCHLRQIVKEKHFVGIDGQDRTRKGRPCWNRTMCCIIYIGSHSAHNSKLDRHGAVTNRGAAY